MIFFYMFCLKILHKYSHIAEEYKSDCCLQGIVVLIGVDFIIGTNFVCGSISIPPYIDSLNHRLIVNHRVFEKYWSIYIYTIYDLQI